MAADVSVLTPSRNYGRFLGDAIESVRLQRGFDVEHIVQDCCSTDGTVAYLKTCPDVDWRSEPDAGQSDGLNRALLRASGRWIAWLNADEFYLPDSLRLLVERGEEVGADIVFGDAVFVDEQGRMLRLLPQHAFSQNVLRSYGACIPSSAVIFRRSALGEAPWSVSFRRLMDWALYVRLADEGKIFDHVVAAIGAFRVHPGQLTASEPALFRSEYDRLLSRRRPASRAAVRNLGALLHAALKASNGAYLRQIRTRHLHGACARWFADGANPDARLVCDEIARLASGGHVAKRGRAGAFGRSET